MVRWCRIWNTDWVCICFQGLHCSSQMAPANLSYIDELLRIREHQYASYRERLGRLPLQLQSMQYDALWNSSYFPIVLPDQETMLNVKHLLESHEVYPGAFSAIQYHWNRHPRLPALRPAGAYYNLIHEDGIKSEVLMVLSDNQLSGAITCFSGC